MNGSLSPSLIRTFTPFIVGYVVSFFARHGLNVNDDNAASLITLLVGGGYYAFARFMEVYGSPKWGYILGMAKSPGYSPAPPPAPAPAGSDQPA